MSVNGYHNARRLDHCITGILVSLLQPEPIYGIYGNNRSYFLPVGQLYFDFRIVTHHRHSRRLEKLTAPVVILVTLPFNMFLALVSIVASLFAQNCNLTYCFYYTETYTRSTINKKSTPREGCLNNVFDFKRREISRILASTQTGYRMNLLFAYEWYHKIFSSSNSSHQHL